MARLKQYNGTSWEYIDGTTVFSTGMALGVRPAQLYLIHGAATHTIVATGTYEAA